MVERQALLIEQQKAEMEGLKKSTLSAEQSLACKHELEDKVSILQGKDAALTLALQKMAHMSEICRGCHACS